MAYHPKRLASSATSQGETQIWLLFIGAVYPTTLQILEMHITIKYFVVYEMIVSFKGKTIF